MLRQHDLVVIEISPKTVSQFIGFVKTRLTSPYRGTNVIRLSTEDVERIALDEEPGETASWMPHDSGVGLIRIDFYWLASHSSAPV
nr:hypothetical protein [Mesorhizobium carmichaelinearum]